MRAGLLILLSFAVAMAPTASVLACADSPVARTVSHGHRVEHDEHSCCCPAGTTAHACAACTDDASHAGDNSRNGPEARQSCHCSHLCGSKTPQNHETSQTESVGAQLRLAICVVAARDEGWQGRGIALSGAISRCDPCPEVRRPLLL